MEVLEAERHLKEYAVQLNLAIERSSVRYVEENGGWTLSAECSPGCWLVVLLDKNRGVLRRGRRYLELEAESSEAGKPLHQLAAQAIVGLVTLPLKAVKEMVAPSRVLPNPVRKLNYQ